MANLNALIRLMLGIPGLVCEPNLFIDLVLHGYHLLNRGHPARAHENGKERLVLIRVNGGGNKSVPP